jgi:hypothetical protein
MVDEYSNNPRDDSKERFSKLEAQVFDISHNMEILMVSLESKFKPLNEFHSSNLYVGFERKFGDKEEHEKEPEKGRSISNITSSLSMVKVEAKVDIKPYQHEIDVTKMNQWLQQFEVYFNVLNIGTDKKI